MRNIPRFIPPLTFGESISALFSCFTQGGVSQDSLGEFARAFARYIGVKYAIPAPSGRVALAGLLFALELPKGKEVILPSLTFHSIPAIFQEFGLAPRFVDIDPTTYCIDPDRLEETVTPLTGAIVPVHLYGRACNMEKIMRVAHDHNLAVIEDCAQGCGSLYKGKKLGSFGQGAFFSFGPTKNLSALWAGMAVTDSLDVANKITAYMENLAEIGLFTLAKRLIAAMGMRLVTNSFIWNHGAAPILGVFKNRGIDPVEYLTDETPGENMEMESQAQLMPRPFQGRIGMSQLAKLDVSNRLRIRNGNMLLEDLKGTPGIEIAALAPAGENIYMSFIVRVLDRDAFREGLLRMGIDTHGGNMFAGPELPGMEGAGAGLVAADAIKHMVHLPVYPQMTESDIKRVSRAIKSLLQKKRVITGESQ